MTVSATVDWCTCEETVFTGCADQLDSLWLLVFAAAEGDAHTSGGGGSRASVGDLREISGDRVDELARSDGGEEPLATAQEGLDRRRRGDGQFGTGIVEEGEVAVLSDGDA